MARGVCWGISPNPVIGGLFSADGDGTGKFTSHIFGLNPSTHYYVRAYAISGAGTSYGNQLTFTTPGPLPVVETSAVTGIDYNAATCGGLILSDGGATVTARGVCWSLTDKPTIAGNKTSDGTGAGSFVSHMTGLLQNTTYFARAYATNSNGTGYGSVMSFKTSETVTDFDGNVYRIVKIGTQVWMAENLKTTHYANGDPIPQITGASQWYATTSGAWCNYNNSAANGSVYGKLYNWYAVNDSRRIAPAGWHIPSYGEWQTLIQAAGGEASAGLNMKEPGNTHWSNPNYGCTNSTGFTALPGGDRDRSGPFEFLGDQATWWSTTKNSTYVVTTPQINYNNGACYVWYFNISSGLSVRCIKD